MSKKTICLAMIVKDESKVIERCLKTVKDVISYWVICDTGSSDGTQDIIKNFFKKHNVPGKLYEDKWINFGFNRTLSMQRAKSKADYTLVIDADEVFKYEEGFKMPDLKYDKYFIKTHYGSTIYDRTQLVSNRFKWRYVGVLHEYLDTKGVKTTGRIKGMYDVPTPDGNRSNDKLKYQKDAQLLEKALLDEPDNQRSVFYLAQSYRDYKNYDKAIENYQKRATMGGWGEELYYSLLEIGIQKINRGDKFGDFVGDLMRAYNTRPSRLEALYHLIAYCRKNNIPSVGYAMAIHAKDKVEPQDLLFVNKSIHEYKFLDELALCAFFSGHYQEGIDIANKILKDGKYPKTEEKRYQLIKQHCEHKLNGDADDSLLVSQSFSSRKTQDGEATKDYIFYPYMDSPVGDVLHISYQDVSEIVEKSEEKEGKGFNTNGWIKGKLKPQPQWDVDKVNYGSKLDGFYYKKDFGTKKKIPKIIHQIQLESDKQDLINTVKELHPEYDYKLWTVDNIDEFDSTKSETLRYEILHRYGGIFIDKNSEFLKKIDDEFLTHELFTVFKSEEHCKLELSSDYIGSIKDHPIMRKMIDDSSTFTEAVNESWDKDMFIYPSYYFIPQHQEDRRNGIECPRELFLNTYCKQHYTSNALVQSSSTPVNA
jgi:glycosyltransferase involved in cell wall biosynthesis